MNEVFKKNLAKIKEEDTHLYLQIQSYSPKKNNFILLKAKNGEITCKIKSLEGKDIFLHSSYNPSQEAENQLRGIDFKEKELIIMFGLGLGYLLNKSLKYIAKDKKIIIFERNFDLFLEALKLHDFSRNSLRFIIEEDISKAKIKFFKLDINIENKNILFIENKSSLKLYPKYYQELKRAISFVKIPLDKRLYTYTNECLLCNSSDFREYINFPEQNIEFIQCLNCSLVSLNPKPSELFLWEHYNEGFYGNEEDIEKNMYKEFLNNLKLTSVWAERRLDLVEDFTGLRRGNILDFGCGIPLFLIEAKSRGWKTFGLEPSRPAVLFAKKHLGIEIIHGWNLDNRFEDCFFDVVTLWDVLEHTFNPLNTLKEIYNILKDGGIIALSTPNVSSIPAQIRGKNWKHFDPPRHLNLFNFITIQKILMETKFQILKIKSGEEYFGQLVAVARK